MSKKKFEKFKILLKIKQSYVRQQWRNVDQLNLVVQKLRNHKHRNKMILFLSETLIIE